MGNQWKCYIWNCSFIYFQILSLMWETMKVMTQMICLINPTSQAINTWIIVGFGFVFLFVCLFFNLLKTYCVFLLWQNFLACRKNLFYEKLSGKLGIFCFYRFIKGDLHCAYVVAQLTVGPSIIDCGNLFTGYNLNFGFFVKLITRTFNCIAHKALQSFYN